MRATTSLLLAPLLLALRLQDGGTHAIRVADLKAHIGFLASDELMGREAGTPWNDIAARYIAREFEALGLKPVCEEGKSWFQPFDVGSKSTRNVIALLPGSDAELAKQFVVVGAHFDHVGLGKFGSLGATESDKIHNGADDNASGTAGMLALAKAFADQPCKRSLLFIAFSAEERGLVGSQHYCANPERPLADTVAMFNFDMLGRSVDDYLFIGGVGTAEGTWEALIDKHVKPKGFKLELAAGGQAPSDNSSFYAKKIPSLFFFTNIHADYHRATDHADKINYETEARILESALALIRDLADAAQPPAFKRADAMALPKDFNQKMGKLMAEEAQRAARARHARTDQDKSSKDGDREAAKERALPDAQDAAAPSQTQPASRPASGPASAPAKGKAKKAEPETPKRGVLGIAIDPQGEAGPFTIRTVKADGAGAAAGLQVGDEITAIDDKPVTTLAELVEACTGRKAGDKLTLKVKRGAGEIAVAVTLKAAAD